MSQLALADRDTGSCTAGSSPHLVSDTSISCWALTIHQALCELSRLAPCSRDTPMVHTMTTLILQSRKPCGGRVWCVFFKVCSLWLSPTILEVLPQTIQKWFIPRQIQWPLLSAIWGPSLEGDDALPYLTAEVVLYLMQDVVELVQALARHLAVEGAIRANISHPDICVHSVDLEQRTCRGLENRAEGCLPKYLIESLCNLKSSKLEERYDRMNFITSVWKTDLYTSPSERNVWYHLCQAQSRLFATLTY